MLTYPLLPNNLNTVGNPIATTLQTSTPTTTAFIALQIWIETAAAANTYTLLTTLDGVPDIQGKATFYIESVLAGGLAADSPNFTATTPQLCLQTCKRFFFKAAELEQGQLIENVIFAENNTKFYALNAASKPNEHLNNPIFTWLHPVGSGNINPQTPTWITALPTTTGTHNYTIVATFENNTTQTIAKTFTAAAYQPVHLPIGYNAISYNTASPLTQVNCQFAGQTRHFFATNNQYTPSLVELQFVNSYGGLQTLIATATHKTEQEMTRQNFTKLTPYNYDYKHFETGTYNIENNTTGELNTGYLATTEYNAALDILRSKKVWLRNHTTHAAADDQPTGSYVPIVITNKKHEQRHTEDFLKAIKVEYQVAF